MKIKYEKEDDILNIWLSDKPYEYGEDNGDLVITHYTHDGEPVYIEILFASRFLGKKMKTFDKKSIHTASVPILHRIRK